MTKAGMSVQAIRHRRARGAVAPAAAEIVTPWRLALAMLGIDVALVVGCLVLGAGIAAVLCALCAGYLTAVCRDARPERSNRGGGDLQ